VEVWAADPTVGTPTNTIVAELDQCPKLYFFSHTLTANFVGGDPKPLELLRIFLLEPGRQKFGGVQQTVSIRGKHHGCCLREPLQ
jgi:hypothetical protein